MSISKKNESEFMKKIGQEKEKDRHWKNVLMELSRWL